MTTTSRLLSEHRLIIQVIRGKIVFEGMIAARQQEIDSGWIQPGTNTLIVIVTDEIEVRPSELRSYTKWAEQNLTPLAGSKTAIVVTAPLPTAMSLLLKDTIAGIRQLRVFSTLAPAAAWLGVPVPAITTVAPEAQTFDQS